jgi:hypothetical protein
MDQDLAQVYVATLADTEQLRQATRIADLYHGAPRAIPGKLAGTGKLGSTDNCCFDLSRHGISSGISLPGSRGV